MAEASGNACASASSITRSIDEVTSNISFQTPSTRRRILATYWIVVLISIPLWKWTTSIQRLALPTTRIDKVASLQHHFNLSLDIDLQDLPTLKRSNFIGELQDDLNRLVRSESVRDAHAGYSFSAKSGKGSYAVHLHNKSAEYLISGRHLSFGTLSIATSEISRRLSGTLVSILLPYATAQFNEQHVVPYAPRYRLAFTLLNEDAAAGSSPASWAIEETISHELSSTLARLSVLHNFTLESQVQFYAPLEFEPAILRTNDSAETSQSEHGLTHDQLSVFVNSAEWTLASGVSNDPVLHLVIFVPSVRHRPLRILDASGHPTTSNVFTIPQWGAIYIYNPPSLAPQHLSLPELHRPFSSFRTQLLSLLGVPMLPSDVLLQVDVLSDVHAQKDFISDWQLDALLRRRAAENARSSADTLASIVSLVRQIEGMPVGRGVRDDVEGALDALEQTFTDAECPQRALNRSSTALTRSSRAFFDPGMLALLYFPPEHNLAVYTPLLAPVAVPLIAAVIRDVVGVYKSRARR